MLFLDAFFRFSGVGFMLFSMVIAFRDLPISKSFWFLVFTNLTLTCHYLGFTPDIFELPTYIRRVFRLMDVFMLFSVWLFSLSLFQKNFTITVFHLIIGLGVSFLMLAERLTYFRWVDTLPFWWAWLVNGLAFFIVIHMIAVTLTGRNDDLLEKRRTSRIYMVLIIAVSASLTIVLGSMLFAAHQTTVNVISLWPAIIGINYWLFNIDPKVLEFDQLNKSTINVMPENPLLTQLNVLMNEKKGYLQPNLTVDSLASSLGVGAAKVRKLISQQLGFANFSTYINSLRINDIKLALQNPSNAHIPILTLALNHGFNSLPPFNRAFKQQTGQTPSEYRKQSDLN